MMNLLRCNGGWCLLWRGCGCRKKSLITDILLSENAGGANPIGWITEVAKHVAEANLTNDWGKAFGNLKMHVFQRRIFGLSSPESQTVDELGIENDVDVRVTCSNQACCKAKGGEERKCFCNVVCRCWVKSAVFFNNGGAPRGGFLQVDGGCSRSSGARPRTTIGEDGGAVVPWRAVVLHQWSVQKGCSDYGGFKN